MNERLEMLKPPMLDRKVLPFGTIAYPVDTHPSMAAILSQESTWATHGPRIKERVSRIKIGNTNLIRKANRHYYGEYQIGMSRVAQRILDATGGGLVEEIVASLTTKSGEVITLSVVPDDLLELSSTDPAYLAGKEKIAQELEILQTRGGIRFIPDETNFIMTKRGPMHVDLEHWRKEATV